MACLGRIAVCTIVPQNHIGPIPGIEVGMSWEYRLQVCHKYTLKKICLRITVPILEVFMHKKCENLKIFLLEI